MEVESELKKQEYRKDAEQQAQQTKTKRCKTNETKDINEDVCVKNPVKLQNKSQDE